MVAFISVQPVLAAQTHCQCLAYSPNTTLENLLMESQTPENIFSSPMVPFAGEVFFMFYSSPALSVDGNNLRDNDGICVGDELKLEVTNMSGEWGLKGGSSDSPPIEWAEDLNKVVEKIGGRSLRATLYRFPPSSWGVTLGAGTVLCESDCHINSDGLEKISGGSYRATRAGEVRINVTCSPKCVLFYDNSQVHSVIPTIPKVYGYYNILSEEEARSVPTMYRMDLFKGKYVPTFQLGYSLKARESTTGPRLEVKIHTPEEPKNRFVIRMEAENTGDATAYMEGMELNSEHRTLYIPEAIRPGEKEEILVETASPEDADQLVLTLRFSSETLGCLSGRSFQKEFELGITGSGLKTCSEDVECPTGQTCCSGLCRGPNAGVCDDIDGDGEPETWVEV